MQNKSFFAILFDLSFTIFVTTRIIKFLFVLGVVASGLWAVALFLGFAQRGFFGFLAALIVTPIAFFLGVLASRIYTELLIVMFRIAENTGRLVEQGEQQAVKSVSPALEP